MIEIVYIPRFIKRFKNLPLELQEEALEKIELLKNPKNHSLLKVHKLHGRLKDYYSFSVNYKTRIIFEYLSKNIIAPLSIGDHDMYK